jgi:hypothetical protein
MYEDNDFNEITPHCLPQGSEVPTAHYIRSLRQARWVLGQIARQQSRTAHVRFGSKADMNRSNRDVRFAPKSGHSAAALGMSVKCQ